MNVFSHARARRLLHALPAELSAAQQADLADHLASCPECREYARYLKTLRPALSRAMHAHWDSRRPLSSSSREIQQHWKEARLKHQRVRLALLLAGIGMAVLLILYGPRLLSSLLNLVNYSPVAPWVTSVSLPGNPTATEPLPAPTPTVGSEFLPPQFTIAFISQGDLNIMSSNGEGLKNLTDIHNISQDYQLDHPVWSPDGSKIAFLGCNYDGLYVMPKLYVISRDGINLISMERILSTINVVPVCSVDSISWSPDSKRIAFGGEYIDRNKPPYSDVFIVSAAGDHLENITNKGSNTDIWPGDMYRERSDEGFIKWSPDGKTLAMVIGIVNNHEIYLVDDHGNNLRQLTDQVIEAGYLLWTPDSKRIVFEGRAEGDLESGIYSVSIDTGEIQRIGEGYAADLSPDGTQIVFSGNEMGINVMDMDGQNVNQIISPISLSPHWYPDGKFIAYTSHNANGEPTIWMVSKDGSLKKELVKFASDLFEHSWPNFEISWSK